MSKVKRYRSKIATVEAMRLNGNAEQVLSWIIECGQPSGDSGVKWDLDDYGPIYIDSPAGVTTADQGDYILRESSGEFAVCTPAQFRGSYVLDPAA